MGHPLRAFLDDFFHVRTLLLTKCFKW